MNKGPCHVPIIYIYYIFIYVWEALHPGNITPSSSAFLYSLFLVSFHHLSVLFFSSCFLPLSYSSCSPQPTFPLIEPCPRSELKSCLISRKFPMIFFNGNSTFESVFLAAQTREAGFDFSSPLDKWDRKKSRLAHDYILTKANWWSDKKDLRFEFLSQQISLTQRSF